MRVDTVAQILTYSNVHAHSNMIVMETTQGLLLAAMLERMGGEYTVLVHCTDPVIAVMLDAFRIWQPCTSFLWRLSCEVTSTHVPCKNVFNLCHKQ